MKKINQILLPIALSVACLTAIIAPVATSLVYQQNINNNQSERVEKTISEIKFTSEFEKVKSLHKGKLKDNLSYYLDNATQKEINSWVDFENANGTKLEAIKSISNPILIEDTRKGDFWIQFDVVWNQEYYLTEDFIYQLGHEKNAKVGEDYIQVLYSNYPVLAFDVDFDKAINEFAGIEEVKNRDDFHAYLSDKKNQDKLYSLIENTHTIAEISHIDVSLVDANTTDKVFRIDIEYQRDPASMYFQEERATEKLSINNIILKYEVLFIENAWDSISQLKDVSDAVSDMTFQKALNLPENINEVAKTFKLKKTPHDVLLPWDSYFYDVFIIDFIEVIDDGEKYIIYPRFRVNDNGFIIIERPEYFVEKWHGEVK